MTITPEIIVGVSAGLLAVLFEYVPGLSPWYDKLSAEYKRLLMLGLLVVVALGVFGLDCGGLLDTSVSCDSAGALQLLWIIGVAIGINQGVHLISKRPAVTQ